MPDLQNNIWQHWEQWWTRTGPPHLIALLRIAFGGYLLFYFALRLPHVPMLFSERALIFPIANAMREALQPLLIAPSVEIAYAIYALMLTSLFTFMIGMHTRISAIIAVLIYFYYIVIAIHLYNTSYNRLFLFLLFLFTFSDAGKTYSYEMWRKHGSIFAAEPASILTQRLIAVQITMTYLGVGWQKIWLPAWQGGEMLFYSFQGMWATPFAFWFVRQDFPMWIYDALVLVVKYFEFALPIGLWHKKLRPWFFAGGLLFHLGVSLFLSAIWWFYAMIACYITFLEPEEVATTLKRIKHCDMESMPKLQEKMD